jgi:hypothetical protein
VCRALRLHGDYFKRFGYVIYVLSCFCFVCRTFIASKEKGVWVHYFCISYIFSIGSSVKIISNKNNIFFIHSLMTILVVHNLFLLLFWLIFIVLCISGCTFPQRKYLNMHLYSVLEIIFYCCFIQHTNKKSCCYI